jgi:plastocyanin
MLSSKISRKTSKVVIACAGIVIVTAAILYPVWSSMSHTRPMANHLADKTFPPSLSDRLSTLPSYSVIISDGGGQSNYASTYNPQVISVPAGMTVIWSNDGAGQHTVTTVSSNDYKPPQAIDSKAIAADGGTFMYTFTKPGIYKYTDLSNPKASGIVDVGGTVQKGTNFDMQVGGRDLLPSGSAQGLTLRFIPKTLSIPPTTAITYQVTVSDSTGKLVTKKFDDTDGILDLELVPRGLIANNTLSSQQFVTWGPDFAGQEGYGNTGTFHIEGPFMNVDTQYSVTVTALAKDNSLLNNISDTFSITP